MGFFLGTKYDVSVSSFNHQLWMAGWLTILNIGDPHYHHRWAGNPIWLTTIMNRLIEGYRWETNAFWGSNILRVVSSCTMLSKMVICTGKMGLWLGYSILQRIGRSNFFTLAGCIFWLPDFLTEMLRKGPTLGFSGPEVGPTSYINGFCLMKDSPIYGSKD